MQVLNDNLPTRCHRLYIAKVVRRADGGVVQLISCYQAVSMSFLTHDPALLRCTRVRYIYVAARIPMMGSILQDL